MDAVDDDDSGWEPSQEEQEAEEQYEFFRSHFQGEPARQVVGSVQRAHRNLSLTWFRELQYASSAFRETNQFGGVSANGMLVAYLRGYRSVEWYGTEISNAIATAIVEPIRRFFPGTDEIRARKLLEKSASQGLRDRVIEDAYGSSELRDKFRAFFLTHAPLRNQVAHGIHEPSSDEARACLRDAMEIFNLAEAKFQGSVSALKFDLESLRPATRLS